MITDLLNVNLVAELGRDKLPQETQEKLITDMGDILDSRLSLAILQNLPDDDKEEFGKLLDEDGDVLTFLEQKIPNLQLLLGEVIAGFKGEMLELQAMVDQYRAA